jgi:hypothetical protein
MMIERINPKNLPSKVYMRSMRPLPSYFFNKLIIMLKDKNINVPEIRGINHPPVIPSFK